MLMVLGTKSGVVFCCGGGNSWDVVNRSLEDGQITATAVQGRIVLAGTKNGMYRSLNLGETWAFCEEGPDIPHIRWIERHPTDKGVFFAGTEPAGIYVTRSGGDDWEKAEEVDRFREEGGWYLPYSPEAGCVRGFALYGKRCYAAVEQGGMLRSDDGGRSWELVGGSMGDTKARPEPFIHPDVHSVLVHETSPDLVFAPTGGGLYRSEDGGRTWKLLYECYCRAVWVDPIDPKHLILGPADGVSSKGRIEESCDGGKSWKLASDGLHAPWPEDMVDRFLQIEDFLLALLTDGRMVARCIAGKEWKGFIPDETEVEAVAADSQ